MGIDIYAGRGVVVTVEDFLKIINGNNKSNVVSVCKSYYEYCLELADNSNQEWVKELADYYKVLSTLKTTMKLSEIREIIASTVGSYGEPSKYGRCGVVDPEYTEDLFTRILDACPEADDIPRIQEITAWGSNRYNGYDVPKGVACVVFYSDDCFKRTLSKQGKVVEKLFGHCDESEWTEYSV
jgi:hypothetical protein